MHLNRQIILLFFLSSIVNRQSSIVNRQGIVKVSSSNRQSSRSGRAQPSRSTGPKVKPGPTIGTTTGARPKGIYISNAAATLKINKKNLRVKVAMGRARRIFEPTNNPKPLNPKHHELHPNRRPPYFRELPVWVHGQNHQNRLVRI